ncbi:MAG: hypothetical protein ACRDZO_28680, partial [Egibacteraceae bacterium]
MCSQVSQARMWAKWVTAMAEQAGYTVRGRPGQEAANRAFGVFNATWHLARGLDALTVLLGARLPPLAVRIG